MTPPPVSLCQAASITQYFRVSFMNKQWKRYTECIFIYKYTRNGFLSDFEFVVFSISCAVTYFYFFDNLGSHEINVQYHVPTIIIVCSLSNKMALLCAARVVKKGSDEARVEYTCIVLVRFERNPDFGRFIEVCNQV